MLHAILAIRFVLGTLEHNSMYVVIVPFCADMEEEQKRCRKGTFQAVLQWFGHAGKINDASDDVDKATSSLLFGSAWVLASSCAIHYFLQFGSPGHVSGGNICRSQ